APPPRHRVSPSPTPTPTPAPTPAPIRTVRLRNVNDKCIDVPDGNQFNGNGLQLYDCNNDANAQQFVIEPVGSAYSIKVTNGRGFEIVGSSSSNGANVVLGDYSGQDNQLWILEDAGSGYNLIRNKNSNKCIGWALGPDFAPIYQYDCETSNDAQRWKLEDW
ncbi:Beta-agarase AgaB34, partial [Tetrabaena socialis]